MKSFQRLSVVGAMVLFAGCSKRGTDSASLLAKLESCLRHPSACVARLTSRNSFSRNVLARVGDEEITVADFRARLDLLAPAYRQRYLNPEGRKLFIANLVDQKLTVMAARKFGLDRSSDFRQKMATHEEYLLRQALQERSQFASDAEIEKYYAENKGLFGPHTVIKVTRLQLKSSEEAYKAMVMLKMGTSYTETAKAFAPQKSGAIVLDPLVYFLVPGRTPTDVELKLKQMKIGDYMSPQTTYGGFMILRKDDEIAEPGVSVAQARIQIKGIIEAKKLQETMQRERQEANIRINDQLLSSADFSNPLPK